jgi:hypothetical protein
MLAEMLTTEEWSTAAARAGINKDFYIFRRKGFDEMLPWDFIEMGTAKENLWAEYREAIS